MTYKLTTYTLHEIGRRKNQEDVIFPSQSKISSDDRLFILCDGDGDKRGITASKTVCDAVSRFLLQNTTPEGSFDTAILSLALNCAYAELDKVDDMLDSTFGTTLALLKFHDKGATVAWIGNTSVFHVRPANRKAEAQILFRSAPQDGELLKPRQVARPQLQTAQIQDIQPDDLFFICSDGMLEFLDDERVLYHLTKPGCNGKDKANILMQATLDNRDNHSAHLVHVTKVKGRTPAVGTPDVAGAGLKELAARAKEMVAQAVADYEEFRQFFKGKRLNSRGYTTLGSIAVVLLLILLWMVWPSKKTAEPAAPEAETEAAPQQQEADELQEMSIADFGFDEAYTPDNSRRETPASDSPKREKKPERKAEEKKEEPQAEPAAAEEQPAAEPKAERVVEEPVSTPQVGQIADPSSEETRTPGSDPAGQ